MLERPGDPPPLKSTAPPPARPRRHRQAARGRCGRRHLRSPRPPRSGPAARCLRGDQARPRPGGDTSGGVAAPPIPIPTPIPIPAPTPIPILTPRPQFPPLSAASAPGPARTAPRYGVRRGPNRVPTAPALPAPPAPPPDLPRMQQHPGVQSSAPPREFGASPCRAKAPQGASPGPGLIASAPQLCSCCTRLLPGPPRNSRAWAVKAPRGPRCTPEPRRRHRRRSSRPRSLQPRRRARNRPERAAPKVGAA